MGVHCQPEIPINKSHKGQRLSPGSHLQLLKRKEDDGQERMCHTKYKITNTTAQIKCICSWQNKALKVKSQFLFRRHQAHHPHVVLSVDGDSCLLFDHGVGDLMEVAEHRPSFILLFFSVALLLPINLALL